MQVYDCLHQSQKEKKGKTSRTLTLCHQIISQIDIDCVSAQSIL